MSVKQNNIIKISLMVAVSVGLIFAVSYFRMFDKYNNLIKKSNVENQLLQSQLGEILIKYDSLKLITAESELEIDKADSSSMETQAQKQINLHSNISLNDKIGILKKAIQEDQTETFKLQQNIDSNLKTLRNLETEKRELSGFKNQKLTAVNVNARGVKILSDLYTKYHNKNIQQIRVCFTLEGNEFIKKGDKKILIQVINPRKQVVSSENTFFEVNQNKIYYSGSVNATYNQKDTDVCTYVDLEKDKTLKGRYEVNVFYNNTKIGETIFEYN